MVLQLNVSDDREQALASQIKSRDANAFDSLFYLYKDKVYSLVYRSIGPECVDDVVQDVFIRIFKSLDRFRGDSGVRTWIYRITLNTCADFLRKKGRQVQPDDDPPQDPPEPSADITAAVEAGWMRGEIKRAIQGLPEPERIVTELHYIQGLSYREIAELLDSPNGTIKARVHNAMARLRLKLGHLLEEVG